MTATNGDDPLSRAYRAGAERGVLVLQRCGNCGKARHYPRVLCDACYSSAVEPFEARGTGTVHSWTVSHHPFDPSLADEVPYVLVTVDLPEGVRVLGRLAEADDVRVGQAVRIAFAAASPDGPLPVVIPADDTPGDEHPER